MTETPPAAWFPDPHDPTQYRYWDGAAWTEHRAPRSTASDQLSSAGKDLADGLAKGFTAMGSWLNQNVATLVEEAARAQRFRCCGRGYRADRSIVEERIAVV